MGISVTFKFHSQFKLNKVNSYSEIIHVGFFQIIKKYTYINQIAETLPYNIYSHTNDKTNYLKKVPVETRILFYLIEKHHLPRLYKFLSRKTSSTDKRPTKILILLHHQISRQRSELYERQNCMISDILLFLVEAERAIFQYLK